MSSLKYSLSGDFFSLDANLLTNNAEVTMQVSDAKFYSTKNLPRTTFILNKKLPTIFKHQCYNDYQLPFKKEVQNTEIAHLFEHILLEFLARSQTKGETKSPLKGETNWNWMEDTPGTFRISLQFPQADTKLILVALGQSIALLEEIISASIPFSKKQAAF